VIKPKGKIPSLLAKSTGKPTIYICKRKTTCGRCKKEIFAGDRCFKMSKQNSGFSTQKLYCLTCSRLIITQTKKELAIIEDTLNNGLIK